MSKTRQPIRNLEIPSDRSPALAAGLPVYSIEQISDYLTKGFWKDAFDWGARSWKDMSITYDVSDLSAERQVLAKAALATWGEICGLDFTEATGGETAQIDFRMEPASAPGYSTAWETDNAFDGKIISSATIHVAENFSDEITINSSAFETFIHEIGHALGLGHAGDYNGTSGGGPHYLNDTRQLSIMSYVAQSNYNGASALDVLTPQMADIYSVIKKYGAAAIRETDTTYGNNASGLTAATAAIYDFDASGYTFNSWGPAFTIVDTGGVDTLDFSKFWADDDGMKIDLRGGRFSDVGQWEGNVGIYRTTVIENAFGGVDTDNMTGNQVNNMLNGGDGEDTLNGLQGNDRLIGGPDGDVYVFRAGCDRDRILGFENDIDRIDLGSFDFARFAKVRRLAEEEGGNLVLHFGEGDKVLIENFSKSQLTEGDVLI